MSEIEIDVIRSVAPFNASSLLDLGVDGARNHIPWSEIFHRWGVPFHKSFAGIVAQDSAFTARGFRNKDAEFP